MNVTVKQLIFQALEDKQESIRSVAKKIGTTNATISNFINGKAEPKMDLVYRLFNYLFNSDNEAFYIAWKEYISDVKGIQNIKVLLEDCTISKFNDYRETYIQILENSTSVKEQEFAEVYRIYDRFNSKEITVQEYLDYFLQKKSKSIEMQALRYITLVIYYVKDVGDLKEAHKYMNLLESVVYDIQNVALKNAYLGRMCQAYVVYYQRQGNIEKVIEYAELGNSVAMYQRG